MSALLMHKLAMKYILAAMIAWVPLSNQVANGEDEMDAKARYESIAEDMTEAVFADDEPAVFSGDLGKIKTLLEIASLPSYESGFQKIVDDGTCNQPSFKADRRGNCDGKTAWTIWQIHSVGNGLMFSGDGLTSKVYNETYAAEHPDEVWTGPRLVASRPMAAKIALHIVRVSYTAHHSLCAYTGESCEKDRHPKADLRHARAVAYLQAHPFAPTLEEMESVQADADFD